MSEQDHNETLKETGFWGKEGAGAILFSPEKKKFGLGLRSAEVQQPGTLGSFGGAIDNGDSVEDTIANEMMEELGYFYPPVLRPLMVFQQDDFKYHNYVAIIDDAAFNPVLNWENDSIEWMTLQEMQEANQEKLHFGITSILKDEKSVEVLQKIESAALNMKPNAEDNGFSY